MTEFEMKLKQVTQKAVGRGKLSRRDFMSFAMSVGITAAAANTMFATAARAEPKKGGIFKAAVRPWPDHRLARSRHLDQRLHLPVRQIRHGRAAGPA